MKEENKMGVMPVGRLLISMSWPAVISMIIHAMYNIIDSIFVGMISQSALAAITLIFPVQMLIIAVAVGTGIGLNSLISRRLGAGNILEADLAASHGLLIAVISGLLFAVSGLLFSGQYMKLYDASEYIVKNGTAYLTIVSMGSAFVFLQINSEKVLQATGNMLMPMFSNLTGAIINIVLDPFLIFGIGIFPRMGLTGAAIATVFGQFVAMSVSLSLLLRSDHAIKVKLKGFKINYKSLKDIYSVGFPSMLMQSISAIMLFAINGMLAFSETAIAVFGVFGRLQSFVLMPIFGLNQGAMPIMGYNFGARNRVRLMETYKKGLKISVGIEIMGTLMFFLIPAELLGMFSASPEMLEIGVPALKILSLCFIPAAFGIMTSILFQATGHGMLSLWQSLIRQMIGVIPIAWILIKVGGVMLVWWAWPIAELFEIMFAIVFLKRLYENEILKLDDM